MRFLIGLALTIVAGVVDAIGYIELGGFFASFMSGASISLGVNVSVNEWSSVSQAGLLIAVFVIGATTSSMITGVMRPWGIPVALLLEASCLTAAVLMIARGCSSIDAIVPVVAAMGIQNTALRPINGVRLGVTFMTGTLVSLSRGLGRFLIGRAPFRRWLPHLLVWFSFVGGAAAGSVMHMMFGFIAIATAAIAVWMLVAFTAAAAVIVVRKRKHSVSIK